MTKRKAPDTQIDGIGIFIGQFSVKLPAHGVEEYLITHAHLCEQMFVQTQHSLIESRIVLVAFLQAIRLQVRQKMVTASRG